MDQNNIILVLLLIAVLVAFLCNLFRYGKFKENKEN